MGHFAKIMGNSMKANVKRFSGLILFLFLVLNLQTAKAQSSVEFTPFVGHRWGGSLQGSEQATVPDYPDVIIDQFKYDEGTNYGLTVGFNAMTNLMVELSAETQSSALRTRLIRESGIEEVKLFDLNIGYWQLGMLYVKQDNNFQPFFGVNLGLTHFRIEDRSNDVRFNFGFSLGAKYFFTDHVGLRAQSRLTTTFVSNQNRYFCNSDNACIVFPISTYMNQIDLTIGLVIAF